MAKHRGELIVITKSGEGIVLDFDWGRIIWLVSGEQGNSQTLTFGRVTIKAGHANMRHRHPNCDEILHVVSGQIEHTLGGESSRMGPGDTISIPTNMPHNARTISAEDAEMLICFSAADRQTEMEQ